MAETHTQSISKAQFYLHAPVKESVLPVIELKISIGFKRMSLCRFELNTTKCNILILEVGLN